MIDKTNDIPLVSSELIEHHGLKWCCIDQLEENIKCHMPVVVNTDISTGPGIHWICIVEIDEVAFIIDPLGPDNFRPYDELMFKQFSEMGLKPVFYNGKFQFKSSTVCGYFSMLIANELIKLKKRKYHYTIEDADKVVNQAFGRTADKGDLETIIEYWGL